MRDTNTDDLTRWTPELSEEGRVHLQHLRRDVAPQIALVRRVRSTLGFSQKTMADLLGITQSAVSKLEARDDASLSTLAKLAEAKGVRLRLVLESDAGEEMNVVVSAAA